MCEDDVQYSPIGGVLVDKLFVAADVRKIFAYRSERLSELFGDNKL